MSGVVDFHAHVLPGIDDGSSKLSESITMLQMAAQQGVQCVVATPHFYARHDQLDVFLERRKKAEQMLREEMAKYSDLPEVRIGAEVRYFPGISESSGISQLTIGGGRYILIEMPHMPWPEDIYRQLEKIYINRDLIPIIAHVDRYISPRWPSKIPQHFAQLPVLVQANADFFTTKNSAAKAMRMLKNGQIHLLGSDCHNLGDRKPNMGQALEQIEKHLGQDALMRINACELAVLRDHPLY